MSSSSSDSSGNKTNTDSSGNNTQKDSSGNNTDDSVKPDSVLFNKDNYLDKNTLLLTASFLAIYFIIYAFLGIFYDGSDPEHHTKKAGLVDIIVLILMIVIGWVYYYSLPLSKQATFWSDMLDATKTYLNNAYSIVEITLFIILFYTGIYIFGIPMTPTDKPWSVSFLESKAYILLFILLFIQFFKYVLKIDIIGVIFGDISLPSAPPVVIENGIVKKPKGEEVFNISNNLYSYEDAKAVCKAMGSRLATYDEVEESYNNGGEWSTYGWSEGQHAYFPTQKATWNKLQSVKGHEHDLGRPGVNGGYFSNPNVRFGVNCYGVKPPMTDSEKALMSVKKDRVYPKNKEDQILDAKVEFWKANKDKMMVLNGFNEDSWSRY
jgi:hypothetical protein